MRRLPVVDADTLQIQSQPQGLVFALKCRPPCADYASSDAQCCFQIQLRNQLDSCAVRAGLRI